MSLDGGLILGFFGLILTVIAIPKENRKSISIFFNKILIKIFPLRFNIAISIEFEEGLNSGFYYKEIVKKLRENIHSNGLSKIFKIEDCSSIIKFQAKEEAEKFLEQKGLDLIIWGEFSTDQLKEGGENINNLKINFTYNCLNKSKNEINLDIQSKFAEKNFRSILEKESFKDINIISDNINTLCLYTLGVSLKVLGQLHKSIHILEKLHNQLSAKNDDFKRHTAFHIIDCCSIIIYDSIFDKRSYRQGVSYCNKILEIDKNNHFAIGNLAILYYKLREINEAKNQISKLTSLYPDSQITLIDNAFFKILEKSYSSAYKIYEKVKLIDKYSLIFNPQTTIDSLGIEYEISREPAFLYASGIIGFYFSDKLLANKDLNLFLQKTNGLIIYNKMRKRATKILNKKY